MADNYAKLEQESTDGSSKAEQERPSMVLYVADVYMNDIIGWVRTTSYWKDQENRIFVSSTGAISTPPTMLLLSLCVMPFIAIVLLPFIGPFVIIKAASRKLTRKGLMRKSCSSSKDWEERARSGQDSWASTLKHFMEVLFWIFFLTVGAIAPCSILLVHCNQHVKQVMHSNSLSGVELCTPILLAMSLGYYTGMALMELGHSKKVVANAHAVFDWHDMYQPPAFNKMAGMTAPLDTRSKADKLKVIINTIRETVANTKQEHMFGGNLLLLDEDKFRNDHADAEFVDETLEEYAENFTLETNSPHLQMNVSHLPVKWIAVMAFVLSLMPPVWMLYNHPKDYLQGKCSVVVRILAISSFISWLLTLVGIMVSSYKCFTSCQKFLQEQALALYIASPSAQRRAFHSVYKGICDELRVTSEMPSTCETSFELTAGDLKVSKNTGPLSSGLQVASSNFRLVIDSLRMPLLPQELLEVRLQDDSEPSDIYMDKFQSLTSLNIATYDSMQMWMMANASIDSAFLSMRIQEALILMVFLMATAVSILFTTRKLTCGVVMSGCSCLCVGFHFNNAVQQGIQYNRMRNETLPALIEGWGDSVRKTCHAFVNHVQLVQHINPMSVKRTQMDNYIRCLVEPFEQMIKEVATVENQVTVFGIPTNVQTLTRLGLTLGTALATALVNYIKPVVHDLMEDMEIVTVKSQ